MLTDSSIPLENNGHANIVPYQFKPGQSGNPGGRPRKQPITEYLIDQLDQPIPETMKTQLSPIFVEVYGTEATFGQVLAFKLVTQGLRGDMQAAREILDRVEGKVTKKVEHGGRLTLEDLVSGS